MSGLHPDDRQDWLEEQGSSQCIEPCAYYQPIVSMCRQQIYGYEVLARGRCSDGRIIGPHELFRQCRTAQEQLLIERSVREQALQRLASEPANRRIFLNFSAVAFLNIENLQRDSHLLRACRRHGIAPERIVIELTELDAPRFDHIAQVMQQYRQLGFGIAVDDWGAGASNYDRICAVRPDIVKVDCALVWAAARGLFEREAFRSAVGMLAQLRIGVVAEGIENDRHLQIALEAGCGLAQGFGIGRPEPELVVDNNWVGFIGQGLLEFRDRSIAQLAERRSRLNHFADLLQQRIASSGSPGTALSSVVPLMREHPGFCKAYVLDKASGMQLSPNLIRQGQQHEYDEEHQGRNWSWRPYYLETMAAIQNGATSALSGPYLDNQNREQVYTLGLDCGNFILCADVLSDMIPSIEQSRFSAAPVD